MLSFRTKIFCSILFVALLATAVAAHYSRVSMEQLQMDSARERLVRGTTLAAALLEKLGTGSQGVAALETLLDLPDMRLTLMEMTGKVIVDTANDAVRELDNHADRPEVKDAIAGQTGFIIRHSATTNKNMCYAVAHVGKEHLLRVAVPLSNLQQTIESRAAVLMRIAMVVAAFSFALAVLLSGVLRRSLDEMVAMVEAISLGNFRRRLLRVPGKEFVPLAGAVNRMAESIGEQVRVCAEQTAQLETILDTMSDGVLVLGAHGRIRRCNSALIREFPEAANAFGAPVVEIIASPRLQEAVDDIMQTTAMAEKQPAAVTLAQPEQQQSRFQLNLPSGQVLAVCISRPVGQTSGRNAIGAVVVFHDITELVRLERVRRDFVANVSHELRTPLTAIQGYAETLLSLECPPECRHFAEIILKQGVFLNRMLEDLLSLARLEGKPGSLELAPVDAREVINQAVSICRKSLESKHCHMEQTVPEGCMVMASQPHLVRVFRNLLENALRYTVQGGSVRVSAKQQDNVVTFRVVDDGPGIPPEALERIFERFYQVENHRGQGTSGLGLAICKHILEQHGSRIWAESPAADGSTAFVFTLAVAPKGKPLASSATQPEL